MKNKIAEYKIANLGLDGIYQGTVKLQNGKVMHLFTEKDFEINNNELLNLSIKPNLWQYATTKNENDFVILEYGAFERTINKWEKILMETILEEDKEQNE